jgi:hypothetical protein
MTTEAELAALTAAFLRAVSFEPGERPDYEALRELFIEGGMLQGAGLDAFIAPRRARVDSGALTEFEEVEQAHITERFGNVAHRMSTYGKRGVQDGVAFAARGVISTQFVKTPDGWRMSSMAWDDERPGLSLPERYAA